MKKSRKARNDGSAAQRVLSVTKEQLELARKKTQKAKQAYKQARKELKLAKKAAKLARKEEKKRAKKVRLKIIKRKSETPKTAKLLSPVPERGTVPQPPGVPEAVSQ